MMNNLFVSCSYLGKQKDDPTVYERFFSKWFVGRDKPNDIYEFEELQNEMIKEVMQEQMLVGCAITILQIKEM